MRSGLLLALAIATSIGVASADKVKTNQATKVLAKPGEHGKVIVSVKSGQNMTLLSQDGRWLKVRVQGRTGYVPRSKVDMPDSGEEIVRNTRRRPFVDGRSTQRGGGGDSPSDRIGGDATESSGGGDDDSGSKSSGDSGSKSGDDDSGDDDSGSSKGGGGKGKGGDDAKVSDDDSSSDEPARPTAHVSGKTNVYSERDKDSERSFVAKSSTVLYPGESKGKWTFVETEEGDSGWLMTSELSMDEGGGGDGSGRKRVIVARARLGVSFLSQGMRTAGAPAAYPDSYNDSTSAATLSVGGAYVLPYGKSMLLGADLGYDAAKALPGIHYRDMATGMTQDIGVTVHNLNLRGLVGYDFHKPSGMTVFGRLGYRYYGFVVDGNAPYDPKQNIAKLPSEVTTGITIGAALDIPRVTDKIGLAFALDAMAVGVGVTQTKALEDGASPSAKWYTLGGVFTYHWKPDMELQGTYDLNYGSYDFGKPLATSMRAHMGTDVTRTDVLHTVTFGIAKGF